MHEIAEATNREPVGAVPDLLAEEYCAVNMISFNRSEENLRQTLTHPLSIVISDGFRVRGRPHPRLHGTFPFLLGTISRERRWMSLPEAVTWRISRCSTQQEWIVRPRIAAVYREGSLVSQARADRTGRAV